MLGPVLSPSLRTPRRCGDVAAWVCFVGNVGGEGRAPSPTSHLISLTSFSRGSSETPNCKDKAFKKALCVTAMIILRGRCASSAVPSDYLEGTKVALIFIYRLASFIK